MKFSRTVWLLSLVSLFTDMASEMLYPVMPMFLKSIGFSVLFIGILEGCAEALAGLSKAWFGRWSDSTGKRLPFVQVGYTLSAVSKPLMALFAVPAWVFLARTMDRLGKGIRSGARDAMLSAEATPKTKGAVFGLHRSMDTIGAVLGPLLALVFLYFYPDRYRALFIIAFVPGLLAILATLAANESPGQQAKPVRKAVLFTGYWRNSSVDYRRLTSGLLLFTLINSSDVFLLLKVKQIGFTDVQIIGFYIWYNLVYAATAYPLGLLADKAGFKTVLAGGLVLFSCTYLGMAIAGSWWQLLIVFTIYGMYAAATEGVSKAWISNLVPGKETATALGTYAGLQSVVALPASAIAGWLWYSAGASVPFILSGCGALVLALYFLRLPRQ